MHFQCKKEQRNYWDGYPPSVKNLHIKHIENNINASF